LGKSSLEIRSGNIKPTIYYVSPLLRETYCFCLDSPSMMFVPSTLPTFQNGIPETLLAYYHMENGIAIQHFLLTEGRGEGYVV
jgi:hypothetical protein